MNKAKDIELLLSMYYYKIYTIHVSILSTIVTLVCKYFKYEAFLYLGCVLYLLDVTDSLTGRLTLSAISTMHVDRFGRSLRFLEFKTNIIQGLI